MAMLWRILYVSTWSFEVEGKEHMGMQIEEVSHGFKQASRQWFLKFDQVVTFFYFK